MSSSTSTNAVTSTSSSLESSSSAAQSSTSPPTDSSTPAPTTSTPESTTTPPPSTSATDSPTTTSAPPSSEPTTSSPSSTPSPEPMTSTSSSTSTPPSSTPTTSSTENNPPTTSISNPPTTVIATSSPPTQTLTNSNGQVTTIIQTQTSTFTPSTSHSSTSSTSTLLTHTSSSASSTSATSATAAPVVAHHGLGTGGTIAVAVAVPLVAVVLFGILGLFLWKRHTKKKASEELRRKEVEDYGYNPNNDISGNSGILGVAGSNSGMIETEGYRGWGNTAGTRKVSAPLSSSPSAGTALSSVPFGATHSDNGFSNNEIQHNAITPPAEMYGGTAQAELYGTSIPAASPQSPTFTHNQNRHSQAPLLVMPHRPSTADSSTIGAGAVHSPVEADDGLHRGVSNASSRYTNATHETEGSEGGDVQYPPANQTARYYANEAPAYYDDMNTNTHPQDQYNHYNQYASMQEQEQRPPMIQQVSARRNTRIETPTNSHYPLSSHQGNSGIAQNF